MIHRIAALALGLLLAACGHADPGTPLDRSVLKPAFSEDFRAPPSFYDAKLAPRGRWKTNFFFSFQDTNHPKGWIARTLQQDRLLNYFGDPLRGMNPFEWRPGQLTIVGQANPLMADPLTNGFPYLSGLITTEKSFQQRYGFFEARITIPCDKGLWAAFWLLPAAPFQTGQQEIDVFENIGRCDQLWMTVHHDAAGRKVGDGDPIAVARVDQPHTYGVLVTPDRIVWYVDDREVRRRQNTDFQMPAYMLIDLGIGGRWPGPPDASTRFPARMRVDWVRAWSLKPGAGGPPRP